MATDRTVYADAFECALAAAAQEIAALDTIIRWALGEGEEGEFPMLPDDWPRRKFYWRKELRAKYEAALAARLKGE